MANPDRKRLLVVAALIEEAGRILMSQRRADQSMPLTWEFPGGKIEAGESPELALRREIEEELGCQVEVGGIYEVLFHPYDSFDLYMLVYRCVIRQGRPQAIQVAALDWFEPARIPTLDMPQADYPLARRLAAES